MFRGVLSTIIYHWQSKISNGRRFIGTSPLIGERRLGYATPISTAARLNLGSCPMRPCACTLQPIVCNRRTPSHTWHITEADFICPMISLCDPFLVFCQQPALIDENDTLLSSGRDEKVDCTPAEMPQSHHIIIPNVLEKKSGKSSHAARSAEMLLCPGLGCGSKKPGLRRAPAYDGPENSGNGSIWSGYSGAADRAGQIFLQTIV